MTPAARDARSARPEVTLGRDWLFPTPTQFQLDNGMWVDAFQLPGQHVVAADLTIGTPLDQELATLEGTATLLLRASDEGTLKHPGPRLTEVLEDCGAVYGGSVGYQTTACTLDVPSTRLDRALPLLAEVVGTPELTPGDVGRHRELRLAQIQQVAASGPAVAAYALRQTEYASRLRHARPTGGNRDTVSLVSAEDVAMFHQQWWGPQNARLTIAGDLGEGAVELIAEAFGSWQPSGRSAAPWTDPQTEPVRRGVVVLVDRPGAVQVDLRIAGVGVDRRDHDWPALQVACVVMGGSFLSRLNRRLREELGYTYGISMAANPMRTTGRWQVSTSVRTEVVAPALIQILELLALDQAFTDDEIADARTQLIGLAPLQYETAGAVVGQSSRIAAVGLTSAEVNRHFDQVAEVSAERAGQAFAQHVARPGGHIVMVGDAEQIAPALQQAGFIVELTEVDFK